MKFKHIINYGTYNLRNEDIQRIRVANLIGIIAPFVTTVYAFLHLFVMQSALMALGDIVFLFFYFSYFLLLGKGYIKTAKTFLLSIAMLQLLILPTLFFSKDGGHYFFFLIAGPLAFLIFEYKNHIHKITISVVSILFFFTGELFGQNFILFPVNISPAFYRFIFIIHILVINVTLLFILQFFNRQIVRKEQQLNVLAKTDSLTGLLNRREFYEISRNELKLSKRHQHELSFLLFDIDHFKQINDNHGHDNGDRVLIKLTEAMRQTVRSTDTISRYGGEEFIIALPETSIDQAYIVAEKLRTRIETLKISTPEDGTITFTVSIGVAGCTSEIKDIDEVIKRADNCLYLAKNEGRNRTVVYK